MAEIPKSHVLLTEKIRRWVRTVLTHENLPNETREELIKYTKSRRNAEDKRSKTIPFELVKTVHKYLAAEQDGLYLHELLEGSDVNLPGVELPPRNPELEARIQKLKAEQANREYAEMTSNVNTQKPGEGMMGTVGADVRSMNKQLWSIFNFLLTVVGAFLFAFKATEYSLETPNFVLQILMGMVTATLVFFADLYFLVKNDAL